MTSLRILYSFPLRMGRVGIGNTAWHQVSGLTDLGVSVELYCGSLDRPHARLGGLHETFAIRGRRLPIGPIGVLRAAQWHDRVVARALESGRVRVDAIHCWPLGSSRTLATARRMGIPTFLERPNTHTAYAYQVVLAEYRRLGLEQPDSITHAHDERRLRVEISEYELANMLLCPSEFVAETFRERGFTSNRIALTQYGFDPVEFSAEGREKTAREGIVLVFAGSAEPRKGLHFALDAWLASPASRNGSFLISGSFSPGYRDMLGEKLKHPSVQDVGFSTDMCGLFQRSDALILPSIEEGSALVTYEAMASGATLLVSRAAGAHARHGHEGLIHNVGDWPQLRDQVSLLHSDVELRRELQSAALAAAQSLTWSDAAQVLLATYRAWV